MLGETFWHNAFMKVIVFCPLRGSKHPPNLKISARAAPALVQALSQEEYMTRRAALLRRVMTRRASVLNASAEE